MCRYKQREREAQKKHEAVEHHLKARLLAAEVKHSPPAKTPTRDWGAQCDTAMAQQDAARQVTRRSPLRDALHVAAAVAPVAREGTDHTPSVRINFIISDSSTTGGLADNVAEARAPTNTEKQVDIFGAVTKHGMSCIGSIVLKLFTSSIKPPTCS